MVKLNVKGHEITLKQVKASYDRYAVMYANNIVEELKKLNISRDDIEIETNILGNKRVPAVIEFWADGHYLRFSYSLAKRFIDNLYIIKELIRMEVEEVISKRKDLIAFYHTFSENADAKDMSKDLAAAKVTLGLSENEIDIEIINKAYKKLARSHHPDLGGDMDEFQNINKAHKLIKKSMGM